MSQLAIRFEDRCILINPHRLKRKIPNRSMPAESKPNLFISYARADDESFVERLHNDLETRGIRVWWDRQSMSNRGLTFLDEIQRAIESVDRVIAVVGPNALKSKYVLYEWDYAL